MKCERIIPVLQKSPSLYHRPERPLLVCMTLRFTRQLVRCYVNFMVFVQMSRPNQLLLLMLLLSYVNIVSVSCSN